MNRFNESISLAEELVDYFSEKEPFTVQYTLSKNHVGTLAIQLCNEDYFRMAQLFGSPYVTEVLRFFEQAEDYERCATILQQLKNYQKELVSKLF
ncbi:hypothetical protein [Telluribacter sp.]|jgi:hypothetical protein|uniref:hypothetical protein n=1 Tax=Telluribacter sp. TaxID=1978767 RepID=UPI002E0FC1E0|nr:hypothetical protein [Telluribacter sp.]